MKKSTKRQILILIVVCLFTLPMLAQDAPPDFEDILNDGGNPDDAPIADYFWMGMITILTVVYLVKKKNFTKV